jgi:hypothetical protein
MSVQPIHGSSHYNGTTRTSRKRQKPRQDAPSPRTRQDVYEPSSDAERAQLLKAIQGRIKSGYYNSREVIDDLSDSFAKAFDRVT